MHLAALDRFFVALVVSAAFAAGCAGGTARPRGTAPTIHATDGHAAVVVRVAMPWYAPRFVVRRKFIDALPEYEANAAIVAKYFSISDAREFGGLYLWTTRGAAEAHFDLAWRAGVRARRGAEPDVRILEVPWLVEGTLLPNGERVGRRSLSYPAAAVWLTWKTAAATAATARPIADALRDAGGLLRAFVVVGDGEVGAIALFADRAAADGAIEAPAIARLGGSPPTVVRFEAPLLIDASLLGPVAEADGR